MKAADIPDQTFLDLVRDINVNQRRWATVWEIAKRFKAPEKVIRAKAAKLIQRDLMDGCPCGCRGDFNVPGTPVSWARPDPIGDAIRATS